MVLGVNAKNRKGASVHVDYLIHILEIKPWPPSQSLRSLRSVLIQWENGDRYSGSTDTVVPLLGSIVGEGKIEFNESFRLPVTLIREMSSRGKDADSFQKNCLEFNLCEPRRDKIQLLATAVIDLADYGVVKDTLSVNAPMSSNRSFRNTSQPVLYIKIQPIDKDHTSSSSKDSLLKGVSPDKNGGKSVSAFMNGEYAEEAEVASTDDDVSSHSSLINGGLRPQNEENGLDRQTSGGGVNKEKDIAPNWALKNILHRKKIQGEFILLVFCRFIF
ncbi:hypothetical protein GH714_009205 [Hevea brasiliensis]|uniref:C2 NT-type domain-containing protein n=1 Tax=Hevea brasiliensis TaxID=3981 RepID=A0A6A6M0U9_HEVBR|nr:hypothetical protein GH714_009205 [Hevea brasiliensis]